MPPAAVFTSNDFRVEPRPAPADDGLYGCAACGADAGDDCAPDCDAIEPDARDADTTEVT